MSNAQHRIGMYNAAGDFVQQRVHVGWTVSGVKGLFTGRCLAWWLTAEDNPREVAERIGFLFEGPEDVEKPIAASANREVIWPSFGKDWR